MCNRHVAHMIAEYEAARLKEAEGKTESTESGDSKHPTGLLASFKARLVR